MNKKAIAVGLLFVAAGITEFARAQIPTLPAEAPGELTLANDTYTELGSRMGVIAQLYISMLAQVKGYQEQIADLNAKLAAAQAAAKSPEDAAKVDWVNGLDAKCDTCRPSIERGLVGKNGPMTGVWICCGLATVPPTPADTSLIYIYPKPVGQPAALPEPVAGRAAVK